MNTPSDHQSTQTGITPAAFKLKEACRYLGGLSQPTVRRLIDRGLIKPNRALRHLLIPVAELDRFLAGSAQ
jgi:excisionase family DNA binding protein